jgi:hypothetical protein
MEDLKLQACILTVATGRRMMDGAGSMNPL